MSSLRLKTLYQARSASRVPLSTPWGTNASSIQLVRYSIQRHLPSTSDLHNSLTKHFRVLGGSPLDSLDCSRIAQSSQMLSSGRAPEPDTASPSRVSGPSE